MKRKVLSFIISQHVQRISLRLSRCVAFDGFFENYNLFMDNFHIRKDKVTMEKMCSGVNGVVTAKGVVIAVNDKDVLLLPNIQIKKIKGM